MASGGSDRDLSNTEFFKYFFKARAVEDITDDMSKLVQVKD